MDLYRKPYPVPELYSRSRKLALGSTYFITCVRAEHGHRDGLSVISGWSSCCPQPVFFLLLLFAVCAREERCAQPPAAWVLEGMAEDRFPLTASGLSIGESS